MAVLYETGLRIGATLQVRWSDYDAATRQLHVRGETQKQQADQVFTLTPATAALLEENRAANRTELLLPWPYNRGYLWNRLKMVLIRAGLPTDRRDKFHKIRRTSATMMELHAGPGKATQHLGHASAAMTDKYLDRSQLPGHDAAGLLPSIHDPPRRKDA